MHPTDEAVEVPTGHDDADVILPWHYSWWRVTAVAVAVTLLAVAAVLAATRADDPGADSVDAGFLQDMRAHHDQAVLMSVIFMSLPDTDPGLHTMAAEVLLSQQLEAGIFVEVLRRLGLAEENSTGVAMAWMNAPVPLEAMPGMASEQSIDELKNSSGADADELFTELMIAHHEGGIGMAEHARDHASTSRVRQIGEAVARNQANEIAELQAALQRSLGAA
ncbi:MAG: DUF305 domain-containing protein [Acidimicrobiia bacterium]